MGNIAGMLGAVEKEQLKPILESIDALRATTETLQKAQEEYKGLVKKLEKRLSAAEERIAANEKFIAEQKRRIEEQERKIKEQQVAASTIATGFTSEDTVQMPSVPKKRYYSACSGVGFEMSYLLTNPDAISGQGYYEVTDKGDNKGIYQPNVALGPTLVMNAATMLNPFFEVENDGSGVLKVISPGEVTKQQRVWQIVSKGKITY